MLKTIHRALVLFVAVFLTPSVLLAGPIVINFEDNGLTDGVAVSDFYSFSHGLTFDNATVLTAGFSLNEENYPPHSGDNVVTSGVFVDGEDGKLWIAGDFIGIAFATPVFGFAGYFTYSAKVTVTAFDSSDNPLGSVTSQCSENWVGVVPKCGWPNEGLALLVDSGGISSVMIVGSEEGSSFALDDVTYWDEPVPVPEPGTLSLLALGVFGACRRRFVRRG
ncbi:MAG TPA: PEP-CTERM sorting domain-containing protein [Vicinamibacterales bacterium]|jgi:hypothetical protein